MATILISRLEEKFQLLLKKMQSLQDENNRLQNIIAQQQKASEADQNNVRELEHKLALLKITTGQIQEGRGSAETRKHLKSTINKYIREIDHCISRLNE